MQEIKKQKIEKDVRIKIHSELYDVDESLFSSDEIDFDNLSLSKESPEPDVVDINTLGKYVDDGERISISYDESEATGMEGSITTITFLKSTPSIVSMIRAGAVSATLVFENEKRHHCIYNTPIMPFEVCVRTIRISNALIVSGKLNIDYVVEIRGAKADRTKFTMQILS